MTDAKSKSWPSVNLSFSQKMSLPFWALLSAMKMLLRETPSPPDELR